MPLFFFPNTSNEYFLADELVFALFLYLPVEDLVKVMAMNYSMTRVGRDWRLWEKMFLRDFPHWRQELNAGERKQLAALSKPPPSERVEPVARQQEDERRYKFLLGVYEKAYKTDYASLSRVGTRFFSLVKLGYTTKPTLREGETSPEYHKLRDSNKVSAFHWAAARAHLPLVEQLKLEGHNINLKSQFCDTPLHFAARYGSVAMVEWLLANGAGAIASIHGENRKKETPLHLAARYGSVAMVELLLAIDTSYNPIRQNRKNETPLHIALAYRKLDIANRLIDNGASLFVRNSSGQIPFHLALQENFSELVDFMIEKDARVLQSVAWNNRTALHYAAASGCVATMAKLIEHTPDIQIDVEDRTHHYTPLTLAAKNEHYDAVFFLLDKGAKITNLVVDLVIGTNTKPAQKRLEKLIIAKAFPSFLLRSIHLAMPKKVKQLLAMKSSEIDVNQLDAGGRTLLHQVTYNFSSGMNNHFYTLKPFSYKGKERLDIVKQLVERGATINVVAGNNITPLWYAIKAGQVEVIRFLLENGGRLNPQALQIRDDTGLLELAISQLYRKNSAAVVELLVEFGADVTAINEQGHHQCSIALAGRRSQVRWNSHESIDHRYFPRVSEHTGKKELAKDAVQLLVLLLVKYKLNCSAKFNMRYPELSELELEYLCEHLDDPMNEKIIILFANACIRNDNLESRDYANYGLTYSAKFMHYLNHDFTREIGPLLAIWAERNNCSYIAQYAELSQRAALSQTAVHDRGLGRFQPPSQEATQLAIETTLLAVEAIKQLIELKQQIISMLDALEPEQNEGVEPPTKRLRLG